MRTQLTPEEIMEILIEIGLSFDEARDEAIQQSVDLYGYDRELATMLVDRPLFVMRMQMLAGGVEIVRSLREIIDSIPLWRR